MILLRPCPFTLMTQAGDSPPLPLAQKPHPLPDLRGLVNESPGRWDGPTEKDLNPSRHLPVLSRSLTAELHGQAWASFYIPPTPAYSKANCLLRSQSLSMEQGRGSTQLESQLLERLRQEDGAHVFETSLGKIASILKTRSKYPIMVPCVESQHLAGSRA